MCVFNNEYNSLIFTLYYISLSQSLALTLTISRYPPTHFPYYTPLKKIIIVRLHVIPESQNDKLVVFNYNFTAKDTKMIGRMPWISQ